MIIRDRSRLANADNAFLEQEENLEEKPVTENSSSDGIIDFDALLETYIVDMVSSMPDEQREAYLNSDEFAGLMEAGIATKRSIVRINKTDDLTRRVHLAALQKAKENGDAAWDALRRNRIKERELLNTIYNRYANLVRSDAIKTQKRLIRLNPRAFAMMARDIR